MRRISAIFVLLLGIAIIGQASSKLVRVSSQNQFDACVNRIRNGEDVNVSLTPGTYMLRGALAAKAPLTIRGYGASITFHHDIYRKSDAIKKTKTHYICRLKSPINAFSLFVDKDDHIVPISESVNSLTRVNYCQSIEGTYRSGAGTDIKIPIANNLNGLRNKIFEEVFGYFDCGWTEIEFAVDKSDDYYFYAKTLTPNNTGDFNYDKKVYKKSIRYVLFNALPQAGHVYYNDRYIYVPREISELRILNNNGDKKTITAYSDIILEGVTIKNFGGIGINSQAKTICSINNCSFKNSISYAIKIYKNGENDIVPAEILNCNFDNCSLLANNIISIDGSRSGKTKGVIRNCSINRYGEAPLSYKNCTGAILLSTDALVEGCTITNTPRCHIYINGGTVMIRNNTIYNTPRFNSYSDRNLSSDLGLIYVNHFTKDRQRAISNTANVVKIEGNLLYGAKAYGKDARGIFIDNGRGDVTCRNNLIIECQLYSIDSRNAKNFVETSSIRNRIENNFLGNKYRLASGEGLLERFKPISNENIMLTSETNILSGVISQLHDIVIIDNLEAKGDKDKVVVPSKGRAILEKYVLPQVIKDRFVFR